MARELTCQTDLRDRKDRESLENRRTCMKLLIALLIALLTVLSTMASAQVAELAPTAACYFTAVEKQNLKSLTDCFSGNAVILDVNRRIEGQSAIRAWAKNEVMGGKYQILETTTTKKGISVLLRFAPPGTSGNGFKARYEIEITDGKISFMNLQYA
jgi:uncharacterized membrane protein (DUF4010 family)